MAVLRLLLRATFRHRWKSWLLLGLLVSLVSGLVFAAAVAGRRTASAFPRYEAAHGYDAFLYSTVLLPKLAALPEVRSSTLVRIVAAGSPTCACTRPINTNEFSLFEVSPGDLPHMVKLVSGRMPNQSDPDEVLASDTLQQDDGVHVGSVFHVPLVASSQRGEVLNDANLTPRGPLVTLHVVGIETSEIEFPATTTASYDLYTTQAFDRTFNPKSVSLFAYFERLHHGAADLPRFETAARAVGGLSLSDIDTQAGVIERAIHPQAVGWWVLAALAGLVGALLVAQALARQATIEGDSYVTLRALGLSRRGLITLGLARTLIIGIGGVVGGVLFAFLLSPLTPVGEARLADPSVGFMFDPTVLLSGAVAAVAVTFVLGLWPAIHAVRLTNARVSDDIVRPSHLVAFLSHTGAPPSVLIGMRHALERGRGRTAVPVGSALVGSILAVAALCATAGFGASLTHLTNNPSLYGQPFDLSFSVNQTGSTAQTAHMLSKFRQNKAVTAITAGLSGDVTINRTVVDAIAGLSLRGKLLAQTTTGRLPRADNEVALGMSTLRQLGAHIGSVVRVKVPEAGGGPRSSSFHVVGTAVFAPNFSTGGLGTGALFSLDALSGTHCDPGPRRDACVVHTLTTTGGALLIRTVGGAKGQAAERHLSREYPSAVSFPSPPTNLVNFGEAVNFPLLFGLVLILFGAATLLHVLVVSVVRRRREVGLLRALGFVRRQVAFSVSWQTTTTALIGIGVGVPVGIAVGRAVWSVFANSLGVVVAPVIVAWAILAVAGGTLLIANLLAIGPALVASRSRPAVLLQAE